jgi:hypothetical protein
MRSFLLCFYYLLGAGLVTFAQEEGSTRTTFHYVGVQANQLVRQVLNFGNNTPAVNNPYLLIYSATNATSGNGISAGLGYTINQFSDGDPINKRESNISNFSFRVGYEKRFKFGKRWLAASGIDLLIGSQRNKTINTNDSPPNKFIVETINKVNSQGLGPRFALHYLVTERILLGTEISYYYTTSKIIAEVNTTSTFQEFDPNTGQQRLVTRTEKRDTEEKGKNLSLNLPVALFLTLKF